MYDKKHVDRFHNSLLYLFTYSHGLTLSIGLIETQNFSWAANFHSSFRYYFDTQIDCKITAIFIYSLLRMQIWTPR